MKYLLVALVCFTFLVDWALCQSGNVVQVTFIRGQGCNGTEALQSTCTNWTMGTTTTQIINGNDAGWQFMTTTNKNPGDSVLVQGSMTAIYVGEGTAQSLLEHDLPPPSGGGDIGGNAGQPFSVYLQDRPDGENATYIFTITCASACGYGEVLVPSFVIAIATIFFALQ